MEKLHIYDVKLYIEGCHKFAVATCGLKDSLFAIDELTPDVGVRQWLLCTSLSVCEHINFYSGLCFSNFLPTSHINELIVVVIYLIPSCIKMCFTF